MGKQGKGRRLTDKERMEIIALTRQNPRIKHVELAAKYNVNESTIRKWRAQTNATKIEERYAHGVAASRDGRQRGQAVRNAQFDVELYEWVAGMIKQEQDLAPARVREKARALAAQYDGMDGFKASSGWFYRFCRRYGLPCGPAGRDTGAKAQEDVMTISPMAPMDIATPSQECASVQQLDTTEEHSSLQPDKVVDMSTDVSAAAIALSLQPPAEVAEPTAAIAPVAMEESELEHNGEPMESGVPPPVTSGLLLGLGDMASVPAPSTASSVTAEPSSLTSTSAAPTTMPPIFSMAQAATTHMVHHFKDVLDPQTRLRLVRHFTRVAGEAEMYLVMDDETRLEYVKEFAAAPAASPDTSSPPLTSTVI